MAAGDPKETRGRRWKTLMYLEGFDSGPDGRHRMVNPPWSSAPSSAGSFAFDKKYEYRFTFDENRDLWRLDARRHVPGG